MPSGGGRVSRLDDLDTSFSRQITASAGMFWGNQLSQEAAAGGAGRLVKIRHRMEQELPDYAFYGSPEWTATAAGVANNWEAIKWNPYLAGAQNYSGIFNGAHFMAEHAGTGTLTHMRAVVGSLNNTGGGQVEFARCFFAGSASGGAFFTNWYSFYATGLQGTNRCAFAVNSGLTGGTNHCAFLVGDFVIPTGNFLLYNVLDYPFASAGGMTLGSAAAPAASALLDLVSSSKGLLLPRLPTASVSAPADGLLIYDSGTGKFRGRAGGAWVDLH